MSSFESLLSAGLGQVQAGKIYLAAVSGGADSSAMLAGLAALRKEAGFTLNCVHVEHGIRPAEESRGDARAVEALCENLEVPCKVIHIAPGKIAAFAGKGGPGIEGAARIFRYRALNREARRLGADRILVAHTRDDLLETLLMRILRGAGPAGLAAMPRNRGRITRPLLDLTRQDVLGYLEERGISYRTDATNNDIRYFRNRIRHKLIPLLDDFFPSWRPSLLALAETQSLTADFLASEAQKRLPWESCLPGDGVKESGGQRLREEDFGQAHPILREEAIFAGADKLADLCPGGKGGKLSFYRAPRRKVVRLAAEQPGAGDAAARIAQDLGPIRLLRQNGYIFLVPGIGVRHRGERGFSLLIHTAGLYTLEAKVLGIGKGRDLYIRAGAAPGCGSMKSLTFAAKLPLVFRNYREGDRLYRGGHRRGFSDILDREARSRYTRVITACDAEGPAAFIGFCCGKNRFIGGGDLVVIEREGAGAGASRPGDTSFFELSLETIFGGTDV